MYFVHIADTGFLRSNCIELCLEILNYLTIYDKNCPWKLPVILLIQLPGQDSFRHDRSQVTGRGHAREAFTDSKSQSWAHEPAGHLADFSVDLRRDLLLSRPYMKSITGKQQAEGHECFLIVCQIFNVIFRVIHISHFLSVFFE